MPVNQMQQIKEKSFREISASLPFLLSRLSSRVTPITHKKHHVCFKLTSAFYNFFYVIFLINILRGTTF